MREILVILCAFFALAGYVFHFVGDNLIFGKNSTFDSVYFFFVGGAVLCAVATLLQGIDKFVVGSFIACLAGYIYVYHPTALNVFNVF